MAKRSATTARKLNPRVKVWLELDGDYVFGQGMAEILNAVQTTGSIKEAAAQLGQSYRHIWAHIKEAEQALGRTLVEAHVGGQGSRRSFLTPEATKLLAEFAALRQRMLAVVEQEFAGQFHSL